MANFELVSEVNPAYCPSVKLFKWKSVKTGLQVVLIKRKSPSVQGYFAVATEANDDSGCPHTLEHIVFMGSQKYPYKGLLDTLGAKQLTSTNAWTAQDQTCYTMSTAGYEGFANLLPIYLDHILNATVDESACLTEVYHVDGRGEEKGVVFSEMQGYEHMSDSLMSEKVQKLLFAENSGYSTNTGGNLNALRKLTPEQIKEYHKQVYCPQNLSVIVAGDIEPKDLINLVEDFDQTLPTQPKQPAARPFWDSKFSTTESPLTENITTEVLFPDSTEIAGEILVSWLGPHVTDLVNNTALEVVNSYLTMRGAGKLQTKFIDAPEDQAIGSDVYMFSNEFLNTQVNLSIYGVPYEDLTTAGTQIIEFLEQELLENLDMKFLTQCIDRVLDTFVMSAEEDWATFVELAITEFLYGDNDTFEKWLGSTSEFDTLKSWTINDWKSFIQKFVVEPHKVCVIGTPSEEKHAEIEEQKLARAEEIQNTIDLDNAGQKLEQAIAKNERPIPEELLNTLNKPDFGKIKFISSQTGATPRMAHNLPGQSLNLNKEFQSLVDSLPPTDLAINFENFSSQFVTIKVYMNPDQIPKQHLALIDVVLAQVFSFPMVFEDGTKIPGEQVAQEVKRDLIVSHFTVDYQIQEMVNLEIKVKLANYTKALEWITKVIKNVSFDEEHVRMFIAKHLKSVAESKRLDTTLLASSVDTILLTDSSLRRQADVLISEPDILYFQDNVEEAVTALQQMSKQLFRADNMRVLIAGDLQKLSQTVDITTPWNDLAAKLSKSSEGLSPIKRSADFLSDAGLNPEKMCYLTLCAASDSSHINVVAKGPNKYGHEDLPALALINGYLQMTEGPLWKAIRGPGFAYGAFIETSVQMNKVILKISSASDAISALTAAKETVLETLSSIVEVETHGIDSAICTIVSDLAGYLGEPITAVSEKFLDTVIKGYEPEYVHIIIKAIQEVTIDQLKAALEKYILPLFDSKQSMIFAVAPPLEREHLQTEFESLGYEVEINEVDVEPLSEDEFESESE